MLEGLILLLLGIWLAAAVRFCRTGQKQGCDGCCSSCSKSCSGRHS